MVGKVEEKAKNEPTQPIPVPVLPTEIFKKTFKVDLKFESKYVLLDFNPEELARQMTLLEFSIFKQIKPRELIDNNWSKSEKLANATNVCKLARLGNHIVDWIVSELVLVKDAAFRLKTMEHLILTIQVSFG